MDPTHPITINGNILKAGERNTLSFGPPANDAEETDYIVVQTSKEVLEDDDYSAFDSHGVELLELVSDQTYLCRYKGTDLNQLRELDFVSFVDTYKDSFVIAASLKQQSARQQPLVIQDGAVDIPKGQEMTDVDVILHAKSAGEEENVKGDIVRLTGVDPSTVTIIDERLRVKLPQASLAEVAKIDLVQGILPVHSVKLMNDVAREILHSDININGTAFKGKGQTICVADTGFDLGNEVNVPAPFKNRSVRLYPVGRKGMTDDPDGHGTHVCGSAVGDGTLRDGTRMEAAASRADLIVQSILAPGGQGLIPGPLKKLLGDAYNKGARIHTNSWGASTPSIPYEVASSQALDDFVFTNKDLVVCFAAGNDGIDATANPGSMRPSEPDGIVDLAQVGAEAIAKNIITVGASESERTNVAWNGSTWGLWRSKFPAAPLRQQHFANSKEDMAAFSSRGPAFPDSRDTTHLRIKPDVVAPGTAILSTRSRHPDVRNDHSPGYGPSPDPDWMWDFGTSMSCPLVAGCCAVIREVLEQSGNRSIAIKNGRASPSAALVKAMLINGAVPLSTVPKTPNFASGFGRVDLERSIVPATTTEVAKASGFLEGRPLRQGETADIISVTIPAQMASSSFKVTLVWTDPPGKLLLSDLDLIVRAGGEERHGNVEAGSNDFDRVNNVEQVTWDNPPAGPLEIAVHAYNIHRLLGNLTQDYALVWKLFA